MSTDTYEASVSDRDADKKSFRFSFVLGNARRYASRYIPERRTLQIRVTPARSEEFRPVEYYDGRFIHRAVVKESDGEVFLDLQLKNIPLHWVVTHQEEPWRILVDLWTDDASQAFPDVAWTWNEFFTSESYPNNTARSNGSTGSALRREGDNQSGLAGVDVPELVSDFAGQDFDVALSPSSNDQGSKPVEAAASSEQKADETPKNPSQIDESASASVPKLRRFLVKREASNLPTDENDDVAKASLLFWTGDHIAAVNEFRRIATLNQRLLLGNPEALWHAGESALQSNQNDVASDYFQTLIQNSPDSLYAYYANLRLALLDEVEIGPSPETSKKYQDIVHATGAPWMAKSLAALQLAADSSRDKAASAALIPIFEACQSEDLLIADVKRDCAYQKMAYDLSTDDLLAAQTTLREFERSWPGDERIAQHQAALQSRIQAFAESVQSPEEHLEWNRFERNSADRWLAFTNSRPDLLRKRAVGWERAGNSEVALGFYERAAASESDPKTKMMLLARVAKLATTAGESSRANQALRSLQAVPDRRTDGLGLQDYADVRELALPPTSNRLALSLIADDIFNGFHAENDVRTMVTLSEALEGSREADVLFDKLLAIPSKSESEALMKEEALMNYAETLRNQGRLVKSAEVYLAVANLDNGKNRAEAAYKAGVVYFRAGLLEKAESSWNIAANDLANSKYSALASERLDRIR